VYNHTKLAMMAMSQAHAKRVADGGTTVNVATPDTPTPGNHTTEASAFAVPYRPLAPLLHVLGPVVPHVAHCTTRY